MSDEVVSRGVGSSPSSPPSTPQIAPVLGQGLGLIALFEMDPYHRRPRALRGAVRRALRRGPRPPPPRNAARRAGGRPALRVREGATGATPRLRAVPSRRTSRAARRPRARTAAGLRSASATAGRVEQAMGERPGIADVEHDVAGETEIERRDQHRVARHPARRERRTQARVPPALPSTPATTCRRRSRITARSRRPNSASSRCDPPSTAGSASPPGPERKVPSTRTSSSPEAVSRATHCDAPPAAPAASRPVTHCLSHRA